MAAPLKTGKSSVHLAATGPRVSKIRRDPPPAAPKTVVPDREVVDRRAAAVGIAIITLSLLAIILGFGSYNGWTPREQVIRVVL